LQESSLQKGGCGILESEVGFGGVETLMPSARCWSGGRLWKDESLFSKISKGGFLRNELGGGEFSGVEAKSGHHLLMSG